MFLSPTKRIWKSIWSLRVPNRIKTLVWRAGSDSLPSKANLLRRKVLSDDLCPCCKLKGETTFHALWSCSELLSVWKVKFDWLINLASECNSLLDVFQLCLSRHGLMELFAMTLSLIWARRNQIRIGESPVPLWKISSLATDNLLEFQCATLTPNPAPKSHSSVSWLPPPEGRLKVNFDGAIFREKSLAGLGCIIRNDKGLVMAAFTQTIPLPTSVETVEVLAARSALGFAQELRLDKIILEGDSEIAIKALSSGGWDSSSFGHIIMDIKSLASAVTCVSFSHTRRLGNKVAHRLARSACNFSHFQVWLEDIPPHIASVYLSELK